MLAGLNVHDKPAGDTDEFKVTVPLKPFTGVTVIVELALTPEFTAALEGLAVIVKSG